MNVKATSTATSKIQVVITGKDGITKVVNINELTEIMAYSGDKFQILNTINGENQIVDNFIFVKNGENLDLSFVNGESLTFENFYSYSNVEISFESTADSIYTLSSSSSLGHELANGNTLVYAQGNEELLLNMANGNESLQAALSDQIAVANAEQSAFAGLAAGAAAGTGASTAALVGGGLAATGVAIAAGGSSSSSDGSSSSGLLGKFVDSAVGGIDYYINGTLAGQTAADGTFSYNAGDVISFKVGNVTIGTINASEVNADGTVMPQDLAGVAFTNYRFRW